MGQQETAVAGMDTAGVDPLSADTAAGIRGGESALPEALGEFRILGLLGRGGMGAVYLAEQQRPQREVALKVLRGAHDDPDTLRRFQLEGEALALLDHPNIAHVFATGVDDRHGARMPFLAMELVRGGNLLADADARGLDAEARVRLMLDVCAGVQHAHQRGVIHRDLKPANILVDGEGRPKIMDFGIARIVSDGGDATTRLTEAGQVVGTIPYMSPEQLRGETRRIDVRSDVFALGVILYELLSGRRPRELDASSLFSAIKSAERNPMVPLARIVPKFGGDLDTIVMKALAESPSQRYASVAEFAADLERYLDHRPIEARAPSALYIARKFARRHRALVAAATIALLALLAATAFALVSAQKEREARAQAERNAAIAESVSDFMNSMFAAALPEEALGREVSVREIVDRAVAGLAAAPPADAEVDARISFALAQVEQSLGRFDVAISLLEAAGSRLSSTRGVDPETRIEMQLLRADLAGRKGDFASYESRARRAIADVETMRPDDLALRLKAENELAAALVYQTKNAEAERIYRRLLERSRELSDAEGAQLRQEVWSDLGTLVRNMGRFDEARQLFEKALVDAGQRYPPLHPVTLTLVNNLGTTAQLLGDLDAAEKQYRQAFEGRSAIYGKDHPDTLTALQNLANVMVLRKQFDAALPLLLDLYERSQRLRGPAHPNTDIAANSIAWVYEDSGREAEAEAIFRQLVDAERKAHASFIESFSTQNNLAMLLMKRGQLEEAAANFREAIERLVVKVGSEHPYVAIFRNNYGECLTKLGRYDEALKELGASHEGLVSTFGPEHERVKKSLARIALAQRRGH